MWQISTLTITQKKFSYSKPNIEFRQGFIEKLDDLGFQSESFDIIISNCVINLSPDKMAVLKQAYRILKPGGEVYFSDVYSNRRVPSELLENEVLWGECLSGALYWNDFLQLAKACGFKDPRLVEDSIITIQNPQLEGLIGHIQFYSATYRLFKIDDLDPSCEDYGQAVQYLGGIPESQNEFKLDAHHVIPKGKIFPVCRNTNKMLHDTRFRPYFQFFGNEETHFGIFEGCGTSIPFASRSSLSSNSGLKGGCC